MLVHHLHQAREALGIELVRSAVEVRLESCPPYTTSAVMASLSASVSSVLRCREKAGAVPKQRRGIDPLPTMV